MQIKKIVFAVLFASLTSGAWALNTVNRPAMRMSELNTLDTGHTFGCHNHFFDHCFGINTIDRSCFIRSANSNNISCAICEASSEGTILRFHTRITSGNASDWRDGSSRYAVCERGEWRLRSESDAVRGRGECISNRWTIGNEDLLPTSDRRRSALQVTPRCMSPEEAACVDLGRTWNFNRNPPTCSCPSGHTWLFNPTTNPPTGECAQNAVSQCGAGTYLANSWDINCTDCETGHWCPGVAVTELAAARGERRAEIRAGRNLCNDGLFTNSDARSARISDCFTQCPAQIGGQNPFWNGTACAACEPGHNCQLASLPRIEHGTSNRVNIEPMTFQVRLTFPGPRGEEQMLVPCVFNPNGPCVITQLPGAGRIVPGHIITGYEIRPPRPG